MRDEAASWTLPRRLGFLILAIFPLLHAVPMLIGVIPLLGEPLVAAYQSLWNLVIPWIGRHVLGIVEPITVLPNGSGDTTWNYVQLFGITMISLIVGTAWACANRQRQNYADLDRWLRVIVRYALSSAMVLYGLAKIIGGQFEFPSLAILTQTYGESSPMGLAWNFNGYSPAYNVFTGGAELLAGLLLLARRTTTLGALVAIGVTAHIVALNFCYDIPVKLFSSSLLLMGIYLLAGDLRRVLDVFVHNRPTAPQGLPPHVTRKPARILRIILKTGFVLTLVMMAVMVWNMGREEGPRPALYGLYEVESFTLDGETRPPLTTDALRWRHFIVEARGYVVLRTMDSKREFFMLETDTGAHTLTLRSGTNDAPRVHEFTYEQPDPDTLVLRGATDSGPVVVGLRKLDPQSFELVKRGFHWVNEYPYNR